MAEAVEWMQMQELAPCRYALRHGGASDDLLHNRRDLLGIKRRGQWVADSSLRRYAKESRLQSEVAKLHPEVLAYGARIESLLPWLFARRLAVPAPPAVGPHRGTE